MRLVRDVEEARREKTNEALLKPESTSVSSDSWSG